jgi:glutaminase
VSGEPGSDDATAEDPAVPGATLADSGVDPLTGERVIDAAQAGP